MGNINKDENDIAKLVESMCRLMKTSSSAWISWRSIAKDIYGAAEYESLCIGLAILPHWRNLFLINDKVGKLTEQGLEFASSLRDAKLSEIDQIIKGVTSYCSRLHPIRIVVIDVFRMQEVEGKFVHAIKVDLMEENIASESLVEFKPSSGRGTRGKVVGQDHESGIIYIAFEGEVFKSDLPATLYLDRAFLLVELANRLKLLPEVPALFAPLIRHSQTSDKVVEGTDSLDVADQLCKLRTPWSRFLWGPPGAGKTYGIGHFVDRLMRADPTEKILVVAPSNRAVDVFIEQLVMQLEMDDPGSLLAGRKILRFGYPRKSTIINRKEILGPCQLDALSAEVESFASIISKAERENTSSAELAIMRAGLLATQEAVKEALALHVATCRLVATTVTLAYLAKSPIHAQNWTTVVVDEATMVPPAVCVYLASIASNRFLLAGDPRQLGPVYEGNSREPIVHRKSPPGTYDFDWMGRDMFDRSRISTGEGLQRTIAIHDPRLARITSQRRCSPAIWSKIEALYPRVENLVEAEKTSKLRELPPSPGKDIVILDTSSSLGLARCESSHGSWRNQYTADLAMEVACTIIAEADIAISIAIISPYRAQVKLLKKAIRQEQRSVRIEPCMIELESGTVHQFQGSDADVVIFDMVDGSGRHGIGNLLRGDAGIRLVTVAITRAKGKLVVLADLNWCRDGNNFDREQNPVLWDLILSCGRHGTLPVFPSTENMSDFRQSQTESPIETALLEAMLKHPKLSHVQVQHRILDEKGKIVSRADFAFPEIKYAVYCDGRQWHVRENRWQMDLRQRNKLTELGWIYSVFSGHDILRDPYSSAVQIAETYSQRS